MSDLYERKFHKWTLVIKRTLVGFERELGTRYTEHEIVSEEGMTRAEAYEHLTLLNNNSIKGRYVDIFPSEKQLEEYTVIAYDNKGNVLGEIHTGSIEGFIQLTIVDNDGNKYPIKTTKP